MEKKVPEKKIPSMVRFPVEAQKILEQIKRKTYESKNQVIVRLVLEEGKRMKGA